jgi:zinc protease
LFPKNDPALRQATPASVSSLTRQNIQDYYARVFRPDETTIVVIGQVTPERARSVVEKYFGQWQATGPKPNLKLPAVPPNPPSTVTVPDASRVQDKVILAETLGLTRANPDYYALALGNHVLGGGFYATRLYQQLREETGLVYHVGVDLEASRTRTIYAVNYGCNPANADKARAIVYRNLMDMQKQPVSPDELRQAKVMLLRRIPLAESSVAKIAQGWLYRTKLDLPLNQPTLVARRYVTMTAEQIQAAFGRWLRLSDFVQVSQGPAPH